MATFLDEQSRDIEECDEGVIRRLIRKITVSEERFKVEFKSGIEVDVDM